MDDGAALDQQAGDPAFGQGPQHRLQIRQAAGIGGDLEYLDAADLERRRPRCRRS